MRVLMGDPRSRASIYHCSVNDSSLGLVALGTRRYMTTTLLTTTFHFTSKTIHADYISHRNLLYSKLFFNLHLDA